ncbi:GNAT family N-acetyltransferase [Paenalkalicoccus suaedae]|uniref:GNAT family N-acetyltransferase n=1 Tax=Paenalkalicoccus suaedae TaxID=2592382 RepID=A0A859F9C9_9BACI|nr:GNAT family N-acetyltransferase [Paenalkalicoccus suaedae]QKS69713.1 GNAT family N-acetyltransferase [Paenalkalicoccus suaedae]
MDMIKQWSDADARFVRQKVIEHNMQRLPEALKTPNEDVSVIVKDDAGTICGGITAKVFWHHMHMESLWVDERLRGQGYGSALLRELEAIAVEKGCRFIHLDTFSFQAPEFYKQHGYEAFGMLEDHPKGFTQYFLQKRLEGAGR